MATCATWPPTCSPSACGQSGWRWWRRYGCGASWCGWDDNVTETTRLEAFSDGVLAVAITLLVLDLHDPGVHLPHGLARALLDQWPAYATYAVSFLTIGVIWVNHHDVFDRIAAVDRRLKFINLLLLMVVVVIPFSTALLSHHFRDGSNGHAAAVFYGLVAMAMGLAFTSMWVYLGRHPELLADGHDAAYARGRSVRTAVFGPAVYAVATVIGLVSAAASLILYAAVPMYFAFARSADAGPTNR
ncbi:MAG: DUF1211 domain-containing protein [Actinobacteria bacterium]|nr:DUF1211 domain-containing protein [Actinomycetota bacterium]MBV8960070.1 DUF1211 domain-containing protein [Actinomycetota bacterium]MBV9664616.1 DUF1211 domain-containing protein [Actinomycetota bacterium]MBV9936207.1 DUF1211 domain-containing protein [Actinomycetota bacterium]